MREIEEKLRCKIPWDEILHFRTGTRSQYCCFILLYRFLSGNGQVLETGPEAAGQKTAAGFFRRLSAGMLKFWPGLFKKCQNTKTAAFLPSCFPNFSWNLSGIPAKSCVYLAALPPDIVPFFKRRLNWNFIPAERKSRLHPGFSFRTPWRFYWTSTECYP